MLSRLRIRTKLLLAPSVVLVLQVIVSGGAYMAMLRQNASIETLVGQRAAHIRAVSELAGSAQRAHAQAYQALTWMGGSFPQSRVGPLVDDLRLQQAAVDRAFGALAALVRDDAAGERGVDSARAAWRRYVPAVQDVLDLARHDQSISASAMSKAEDAFAAAAAALTAVARHEQDLAARASNEAGAGMRAAASVIPLLLALSVAASLAITMAVRRAILAGVARIEAAAQGLASGDLTVRTRVDGDDEIAATSRALDAGIRSLNGNLKSVLASARVIGAASHEISLGRAGLPPGADVRAASSQGARAVHALARALDDHASSARAAHALAQAAESAALEGGELAHRLVAGMDDVRRAVARMEEARSVPQARRLSRQALSASEGGGACAAQAGARLAELLDATREMDGIALAIADASAAQARELAGAGDAILQADALTRRGMRMVEEAALAARTLQQGARDLARTVAAFRLDEGAAHARDAATAPEQRGRRPYLRLASSRDVI